MVSSAATSSMSIPHARGGEPSHLYPPWVTTGVFPTHVGVNRNHAAEGNVLIRIPHARGGEPHEASDVTALVMPYSPRTWG